MKSQRRPGWYVGNRVDEAGVHHLATAADSPAAPGNQGWLTSVYWFRAHYFEGHRLPLCGKASREPHELAADATRPRCGHCRRALHSRVGAA